MLRPFQLLLMAVLVGLLQGCGETPPNLLFISIDTTRADRLGAYGYAGAATEVIDEIAAKGFVFRNHLTPVPLTLPAHTSMFTGQYPPQTGVRDNGAFIVPDSASTLAEALREHGYDTSAFVASFPLASRFGLNQGFDHYDDDFNSADNGNPLRATPKIYFDERPAGAVVDATLNHLGETGNRDPFFAFVHFFDPHQPLSPPPPYDLDFRADLYDGEIAYVDEQIGRLIDSLKRMGRWDNTLVVITSDHGEGLGEHGELTHSMLLHQATLHVPLIIAGPGVPVGETKEWSSATQLFDTLIELLGLPAVTEGWDDRGESLASLIHNGGVNTPGSTLFTSYFETIAPRSAQGVSQLTAWMEGDWRMVHGPRPELYNLATDPKESNSLVAKEPRRIEQMFSSLKGFLSYYERSKINETAIKAEPEVLKRLAGLGYVHFDEQAFAKLNDVLDVEGLIDPKDRVIDVSLLSEAKAAFANGDWDVAYVLHKQVLERSPNNVNILRGLSLLYGQTGDWDQALAYIERAVTTDPADSSLLVLQGQLLIEMGQERQGVDILQELSDAKESLEIATWIATGLARAGEYDAALDWFKRAATKHPDNKWIQLYLANHLAKGGRIDDASKYYSKLTSAHPYFHLGFYNFGKAKIEQGDFQAAGKLFTRSAALQPQHQQTQQALRMLEERSL